jgi:hypothetical protein
MKLHAGKVFSVTPGQISWSIKLALKAASG